jgi:7-cyano-7-deazaguanine synthase in queuosine biosynthesis
MQRAVSMPTSGQMSHEGTPVTLKAQAETHDLCGTHGITYRKSNGCGPCNLAKCSECEKCGSQMHKSFGGVLRCPRGH